MSWNNKVIWSEGMFLRPQHFQQHVRYIEHFVENRCGALRGHGWGIESFQFDEQLLTLGKLSILEAKGIFPDGTPFEMPDDDDPAAALDVPENVHDMVVYLALPVRRSGSEESNPDREGNTLARYITHEEDVADNVSRQTEAATLQTGKLRTRLMLASDKRDEYACLPVARIVEVQSDKKVLLDDAFIPTAVACQGAAVLTAFVKELLGLLQHRCEALSGRVTASGHSGGTAEIADFLLLQAVNRYTPLVAHLAGQGSLHPESLYRVLMEMAGELATFTSARKRAPLFETYDHANLTATFRPVIKELRRSLSMVLEQSAIQLPLQERKFGIRVAQIPDRKLLLDANFVLAVHAAIPTEKLLSHFPSQVKIGPVEKIRDLVNLALPGIRVRALPVAPRQIPYQSGFVYFELNRADELWKELHRSGGFAFHIAGDYPDLQTEFWAIKE